MKRYTKLIALILVLIMAFTGCGSKAETADSTKNSAAMVDSAAPAVSRDSAASSSGGTGTGSTAEVYSSTSAAASSIGSALPEETRTEIAKTDTAAGMDMDEAYSDMSDSMKAVDSAEKTAEAVEGFGAAEAEMPAFTETESDMSAIDFTVAAVAEDPTVFAADPDIAIIDDPIIVVEPVSDDFIIDDPVIEEPIIDDSLYLPQAGLLTAGEWNDNKHFDFLMSLITNGQEQNYSDLFGDWGISPLKRLVIHVSDAAGASVGNAKVRISDADGSLVNETVTDAEGMTYIYYNVFGGANVPARAEINGESFEIDSLYLVNDSTFEAVLAGTTAQKSRALDLMFMVDTTGSMTDELVYLQTEMMDVISRVNKTYGNLDLRLSVNFYRDLTDDYVVRSYPFSSNINEQLGYLRIESADGGGDYEEAVELALADGVGNHDWNSEAVKLMFLVLDAPPHKTSAVKESLKDTLTKAAAEGIRIIPVASSGIDKDTEFLLRAFAMTTGGTYTFLTDDSGIGNSHIEATVGEYEVENLNNLIVRLICEYLGE